MSYAPACHVLAGSQQEKPCCMHFSPQSWRHVHCGVDMRQRGCSSCLQRHVPHSHPESDLTVSAGRANSAQRCSATSAPTLLELEGGGAIATLLNCSEQLRHAGSRARRTSCTVQQAIDACCATKMTQAGAGRQCPLSSSQLQAAARPTCRTCR